MKLLITVYYRIVYSHLQYAIILSWESFSESLKKQIQVKKKCYHSCYRQCWIYKTKLKPLYEKINLLIVNGM